LKVVLTNTVTVVYATLHNGEKISWWIMWMSNRQLGYLAVIAFAGTVWLANWLVEEYGIVPVGFGLEAPAGVYAAGLAFTLRDITQRLLGFKAVVIAILVGAGLSWVITDIQRIAIASAVAFALSETLDLIIYTLVKTYGWLRAVAASNVVGIVADSIAFLLIAFGSLTFLWGQIVGKMWMTLVALIVLSILATSKSRT